MLKQNQQSPAEVSGQTFSIGRSQMSNKSFAKQALFLVILLQLLFLFMYGFFSQFNEPSSSDYLDYIFTNGLAALGFGLLLCYFKLTIKQAIFITLFVISLNCQLSPLLQKFWYNVFINGFQNKQKLTSIEPQQYITDYGTNRVQLSFAFARISAFCTISLLASLFAVIGKIGFLNTLITTLIFNVGFNLAYFLNLHLHFNAYNEPEKVFFDPFQSSRIFMFAAGFGLGLTLMYSCIQPVPQADQKNQPEQGTNFPLFFGVIFTAISIYFTCDILMDTYFGKSFLNIMLAMAASITVALGMSCVINGKFYIQDIASSIFAGAIQISIVANHIRHPFVAIIIGAFAAFITTICTNIIQPRFNKEKENDRRGLFSLFLINSFLAVFLVSPIVIASYNPIVNKNINSNQGYPMIYGAISFGIGLVLGLFTGLFRKCIHQYPVLSDFQFFSEKFRYDTAPQPGNNLPPIKEDQNQKQYPSKDQLYPSVPSKIGEIDLY